MTEQIMEITQFSGLNIRDIPARIKDSQLVECQNYDLGMAGELTKRTGFRGLNSTVTFAGMAVTLLGYFQTDVYNQLLAKAGNSVYFSNDGGNSWTVCAGTPHNNVEFGVQYTNKFYLVRRDAVMLEWNGSTMTAIAGSPTGSHVFTYKDRLFVINTYASGNLASRLYFSLIANFSATGWPSTNFIDISQGDGDVNVALAQIQDVLMIFKSRSTWLLYVSGDPVGWTLRNGSPEIGCVSRYTPREIESKIYFVGHRGVYITDGNSFSQISEPIQTAFELQVISIGELNKTFAGWWNDKYIVFLSLVPQSSTWGSLSSLTWGSQETRAWGSLSGAYYQTYVYHLRTDGWTSWLPNAAVQPFTFVEIPQPSAYRGLVSGSRATDGRVFRYGEPIYQDNNLDYDCKLKTKEFDFSGPSKLRRGKLVVVEQDGVGTHSFTNIVNGTSRPVQIITGLSGRLVYKLKGPHYFRVWQISSSAVHSNPIVFFGYSLYVHEKTRTAKSGV